MDNRLFWVLLIIFLPQIVIILDYLLKSLYIGYWDFVYSSRLDIFIENLGTKKTIIRRRTIDGFYIISTYTMFSDRPYEFVGDMKGNISVFGARTRVVKPFIGDGIIAPCDMKILERDKDKYVKLINSHVDDSYGQYSRLPIMGPLRLAPKCDIKKMGADSFSIRQYNPTIQDELDKILVNGIEQKEFVIDKNDPDINKQIRMLGIKTFNRRKKNGEPDLEKMIRIGYFISLCVKKQLKTESEVNKLITEMIYNLVYGYEDELDEKYSLIG